VRIKIQDMIKISQENAIREKAANPKSSSTQKFE
jgi:hypothetical protein